MKSSYLRFLQTQFRLVGWKIWNWIFSKAYKIDSNGHFGVNQVIEYPLYEGGDKVILSEMFKICVSSVTVIYVNIAGGL